MLGSRTISRVLRKDCQNRTLFSVAEKYMEAYKRYGLRDCLWKFYNMGNIKFGKLVGEDRFGTKYYEDPTELHGQHRWCEYKHSFDPFDASQIPPEWHMWLQHMTDSLPGDKSRDLTSKTYARTTPEDNPSNTPFHHHVGLVQKEYTENFTGAHSRGYNVGSIMTEPNEPGKEWRQPNHPLNRRKRNHQNIHFYDPNDPQAGKGEEPIRDLTKM